MDTINDERNRDGRSCTFYDFNPFRCESFFDDDDFIASSLCCACGGGITNPGLGALRDDVRTSSITVNGGTINLQTSATDWMANYVLKIDAYVPS